MKVVHEKMKTRVRTPNLSLINGDTPEESIPEGGNAILRNTHLGSANVCSTLKVELELATVSVYSGPKQLTGRMAHTLMLSPLT